MSALSMYRLSFCSKDVDIKGELTVEGNTSLSDIRTAILTVDDNAAFLGTTSFIDITTESNLNSIDINLEGNIDIKKNLNFIKNDNSIKHTISSDPSGIFIFNLENIPSTHTLHIYGENEQALSVGSQSLTNHNVIASNTNSKIDPKLILICPAATRISTLR